MRKVIGRVSYTKACRCGDLRCMCTNCRFLRRHGESLLAVGAEVASCAFPESLC